MLTDVGICDRTTIGLRHFDGELNSELVGTSSLLTRRSTPESTLIVNAPFSRAMVISAAIRSPGRSDCVRRKMS